MKHWKNLSILAVVGGFGVAALSLCNAGAQDLGSVAQSETVIATEVVSSEQAKSSYDADALVGSWAEKIAGRGFITVAKSETPGKYDVHISWANSAYETHFWEMTAEAIAPDVIKYSDCRHQALTFSQDGKDKRKTVYYEHGTGTFTLISADEITWQDDQDDAGGNSVFINAKRKRTR